MISDDQSREWVKRLPSVLKSINSKELDKVIKIKEVAYKKPVGLDGKEIIPPEVKVRYLYADGELEGYERRRATDPILSMEIYDITRL